MLAAPGVRATSVSRHGFHRFACCRRRSCTVRRRRGPGHRRPSRARAVARQPAPAAGGTRAAGRAAPGRLAVRDLYALYPDYLIDVGAEQAALAAARLVVWQQPVRWYGMPPLLKLWLDDVLAFGWAYGPDGPRCAARTSGWSLAPAAPRTRTAPEIVVPIGATEDAVSGRAARPSDTDHIRQTLLAPWCEVPDALDETVRRRVDVDEACPLGAGVAETVAESREGGDERTGPDADGFVVERELELSSSTKNESILSEWMCGSTGPNSGSHVKSITSSSGSSALTTKSRCSPGIDSPSPGRLTIASSSGLPPSAGGGCWSKRSASR